MTTQISSFPLPPTSYYNQYSDENVKKGRAPKPPPIPATHDSYSMFGVTCQADDVIIRPLESQGIRRLYPQNFDHRRELKKLNHSVLVNYLDLLEMLIICPESTKRQDKIEDINLLFIHIHHLINEFRPHQARETLRVLLELQKRAALETSDRFQKHLDKCLEIIKQALQGLPEHYDFEMVHIRAMAEALSRKPKKKVVESVLSFQDAMMCDIVDSL